MNGHFIEQLREGRSLLLKLGQSEARASASRFRGDLSIAPLEVGGNRVSMDLAWLGIVSRSIATSHGPTGKISVSGILGEGECSPSGPSRWSLRVELTADVLYDAIEEELDFREPEPGSLEPETETFRGTFSAVIDEGDPRDPRRPGPTILYSELDLFYVEGGLGWIPRLRLPVSMPPAAVTLARRAAPECPAANKAGRRILKLRPFAFRGGSNGQEHSGTSWPSQLQAATAIWKSCCLDLEAEDLQFIDNAKLRHSSNARQIRRALPANMDLEGIEVFLVDGVLPAGGGSTSSPGHAQAKVVITNRNAGNRNLLGHELGHVLGGLHPGLPPNGRMWPGDPGTVLEPSNSPDSPNPGRHSLGNCRRAKNPALTLVDEDCCLSPAVSKRGR